MATTVTLTVEARNAQADALARLLDNGSIKVYDGTPPADVTTALSGNTLLATCPLSATSAPAASSGTLTFNAITDDSSIDASGTASFYRTFKTDGTTAVTQGSVATSGGSMTIADTALVSGGTLAISSMTHTV
jgi:hypothetical protein